MNSSSGSLARRMSLEIRFSHQQWFRSSFFMALRFVWHSHEVFVANPCSGWQNSEKVESSWRALPHGWHFRLAVYPNGAVPEDEGFVSAFLWVRPPGMMQGKEWIFPGLQQLRWFTKGDVELGEAMTDLFTLSNSRPSIGRRYLVSHTTIRQRNYINDGKFRIVVQAAFLPVNSLAKSCRRRFFRRSQSSSRSYWPMARNFTWTRDSW